MAMRRVMSGRGIPAVLESPLIRGSAWDSVFRPWTNTMYNNSNALFDDIFSNSHMNSSTTFRSNVTKHGDLLLAMDLPGVKKSDVQVSTELEQGMLKISATRKDLVHPMNHEQKQTQIEDTSETHHDEWMDFMEISKHVSVPKMYDLSKVEAKLEDGVLSLMIPKKIEVKTEKKFIQIQ
mmetsp:Transcript_8162/g.14780  ORF Transcript_8162/g.14780 Transcript_8162/m.14780 type:complete len:179 (+) Transcript_8162:287-823(+)